MVVAVELVDRAQVGAIAVRIGVAGDEPAGEHRPVVASRLRSIALDEVCRHAAAPRLAVRDRAARFSELLHVELAQVLRILGGGGNADVAALAVARCRHGEAALHDDGKAVEILHFAVRLHVLRARPAMRVHDKHAVPVARLCDPVVRAVRVAPVPALGAGGKLPGARRGFLREGGARGEGECYCDQKILHVRAAPFRFAPAATRAAASRPRPRRSRGPGRTR